MIEKYRELEVKWSEKHGMHPDFMVACSSGTAALHLAFEAFGLPPGSEVIMPDLVMIACPRAAAMAGLRPTFVPPTDRLLMEVHNYTAGYLSMTFDPAAQASKPASALLAVHTYGRAEKMGAIHGTKNSWRRDMLIVEDLAEAHGLIPHPDTDAACWSFYKNKIVAGEEGGAVWFKKAEHAKKARQLRSLGFTDAHDFNHVPHGCNYRLSNANAELILQSLAKVENNIAQRRTLEEAFDKACPLEWRQPIRQVPWVYDIRVRGMTEAKQDAVVAALKAAGFDARHCFKPASSQPEFTECRKLGGGKAAELSREVVYLPFSRRSDGCHGAEAAFEVVRSALA